MNQPISTPEAALAPVPAALLVSRDLHQHILSSVSDGVHVIDMNGRVLIENEASARMLGWCDDCLVGKLGHSAIHHHHADGTPFPIEDCPIYATVMDGRPREVAEDVFWRQDGSSFPVEYRTAPLCDATGTRYGVTVVFRDITERKRAALLQATLHAISECAYDCASTFDLYPQVHRIISAILPSEQLHVMLLGDDAGALHTAYSSGTGGDGETADAPAARSIAERVVATGRPVPTDWVAGDPTPVAPDTHAGHWLGVPLRARQETIGALVVKQHDGRRPCVDADLELLQFVSTQIATAIERTQRDAQLRHMAQFDALTDLPNRSLFNDRLEAATAQARRRHEHLALLFIDLDRFKPVNDVHGHAVGDSLLVAVAARLRELLRASDTVGRVGGDEFVVTLHPIASETDATAVAEKIRAALDAPFDLADPPLRISASIGVALYPRHGSGPADLSRAADEAMYRAKRAGGNQVVVAD